ncbi:MAG: glycosyltransferase family 39 protein [Bacteroidales bacterium]|nr:glycosyltransferase family 39 protein [Bacteroidales bacterium]
MKNEISKLSYKQIFLLLCLFWFVINIIQALVMDVISDESYYGLYGKYLDWGYFDHPPMVALWVAISSFLFKGNLSIRFLTVLMQPLTLFFVWKTIDHENPTIKEVVTFFIISASIVMFAAYGFITTPDSPLLLFTALFLFAYKRFLNKEDLTAMALLMIAMAGMVYSKYQAVLVIGFTVLSNIKLLKNPKFWFAGVMALVLLVPHFLWQVNNDFPSFQYHLVGRSSSFKIKYLLEYLPNELCVFNPVVLVLVVYLLFKNKPVDSFEKTLYWQIIRFLAFFGLMTFRGHVEPHWTIACSIPMIILLSKKCSEDYKFCSIARRYLLYTIGLLMVVRVFLCINSPITRRIGYCGNGQKNKAIEQVAGDVPVVFATSFQKPSLYMFFTGKEATTISSFNSRRTQFDIWQFEEKYYDQRVFVYGDYGEKSNSYGTGYTAFQGFFADNLQTVNRIRIEYGDISPEIAVGSEVTLPYTIYNTYDHEIDFNHPTFPVKMEAVITPGKKVCYYIPVDNDIDLNVLGKGEKVSGKLRFWVPDIPSGKYNFGLTLNTLFGAAFNSDMVRIVVDND